MSTYVHKTFKSTKTFAAGDWVDLLIGNLGSDFRGGWKEKTTMSSNQVWGMAGCLISKVSCAEPDETILEGKTLLRLLLFYPPPLLIPYLSP